MSEPSDQSASTPASGLSPETEVPLRRWWHGARELATATGQALLALSELVRPRRDDTDPPPPPRPRHRLHPVEKAAPFPIND